MFDSNGATALNVLTFIVSLVAIAVSSATYNYYTQHRHDKMQRPTIVRPSSSSSSTPSTSMRSGSSQN